MLNNLFSKPKIIAIIGDANSGKSNLIYHLIKDLKNGFNFKLYTFGLRKEIEGAKAIWSINELEDIKDSVIFIDEFFNLFDLEDRKKKQQVESTIRLIFHNNNVLVLCGLPENFKKFISAKANITIYKKVSFDDFINGSKAKRDVLSYEGYEKGSKILNLGKNEILLHDDSYQKYSIPYLKEYDTKKDNVPILVEKKRAENVG